MNKQLKKTSRANQKLAAQKRREKEEQNRTQVGCVAKPASPHIRSRHSLVLDGVGEISFPVKTFLENFPHYRPLIGDDVEVVLNAGRRGFYTLETRPLLSQQVTGTCVYWNSAKNFGFIKCKIKKGSDSEVVKVFVRRRDTWGRIREEDKVRLTIVEETHNGETKLSGRNVRHFTKQVIGHVAEPTTPSSSASHIPSTKCLVVPGVGEIAFPVETFMKNFPQYHPQVGDDIDVVLIATKSGDFYTNETAPILSQQVSGTCVYWNNIKNYGFVECKIEKDSKKVMQVFVRQRDTWSQISEEDKVRLTIVEERHHGETKLSGRNVRLTKRATTKSRSRSSSVMSISQSSTSSTPSTSPRSSRKSSIVSISTNGWGSSSESGVPSSEKPEKPKPTTYIPSRISVGRNGAVTVTKDEIDTAIKSKSKSKPKPSRKSSDAVSHQSTKDDRSETSSVNSYMSTSTIKSKMSTSTIKSKSTAKKLTATNEPANVLYTKKASRSRGRCVRYIEQKSRHGVKKFGFIKCDALDDEIFFSNNNDFDYEIRQGHHVEFDLVIGYSENNEIVHMHAQNLVRDYQGDIFQKKNLIMELERERKRVEYLAQTQSDLKEEKRFIAEAKKLNLKKKDLEGELDRLQKDYYGF